MLKFTILLRRNPAMTQEQFVQHHKQEHAGLFTNLPEVKQYVRRYVQSHSVPVEIPGFPPLTFDGITELWFDNIEGLQGVFGSQDYMEQIRPDEEKFLDLARCEFLLTTENIVME